MFGGGGATSALLRGVMHQFSEKVMMCVRVLVVCFAGVVAASSVGFDDKAEGTWKLVLEQYVDESKFKKGSVTAVGGKSHLVIDGHQMTTRRYFGKDGKDGSDGNWTVIETKYKLSLDPSKKPAVYERTALAGKDKDQKTTGIYKIDGDTLLMCSKKEGLPTDFTVNQDNHLYTYKRVR